MSDWFDRRWLVLTGAGVSTDSGIPDYRGPDAVPRQPMTFQDFIASATNRQRYWARAHLGWSHMASVEPNYTHHFLADRQEQLVGLITQNVDGLHEKAGSLDTVDLHGRLDRVICLDCGTGIARTEMQQRLELLNPGWTEQEFTLNPDGDVDLEDTAGFVVPDCAQCGGRLKPDVVFFGESVPKPKVAHCFDLVDRAGREGAALVVLGSSLQVMSGLRFVRRAAKDGTEIVIVNRGRTRGDELADVRIDDGVAETLRRLSGNEKGTVLDPAPGPSRTIS